MNESIVNDHCSFCDQTDNERIIYRTENFFVRISLGQIVEGYLLIIPNDHYHCIGALPTALQKEYIDLKNYIRSFLEDEFGGCIFYEHGRVGYCNVQPGEQICYHAHTHAVAVNYNLLDDFIKGGLYPEKIKPNSNIFEVYQKLGHYLFYENHKGEEYMIHINQPIPRQYLRLLVAQRTGDERLADWSEYPEWDKIWRTKERLGVRV